MDPEFNVLVETIFMDQIFQNHLQIYLNKCMQSGLIKKELYPLYCNMSNWALKLSEEKKNNNSIRLHQNNPKHIYGGILDAKNLSLDLIATLQAL